MSERLDRLELVHVGFEAQRTLFNPREAAFADRWVQMNARDRVLDKLLYSHDEYQPTSQRDAQVAATIIQWLGSNVGLSFLVEALKTTGFRIAETAEESEYGRSA